MGLSRVNAQYLIAARRSGVRFDRTLTIGRQNLFAGPHWAWRAMARAGVAPAISKREFLDAFEESKWFGDPLLRALGATELSSMDASGWEGADVVHDLNQPVPEALHQRYTLVYDGGSLEHIFDVPTVLRSYMEMVEVGGHLIIQTNADGHMGHGLYQFSPELFYRVLSAENGYEVEHVTAMVDDVGWGRLGNVPIPYELHGPWYEVVDPAEVRERVVLEREGPVVLQVQARRTRAVPVLRSPPQQSDYAATWAAAEDAPAAPPPAAPLRQRLVERLPAHAEMELWWEIAPRLLGVRSPYLLGRERRRRSFRNRRYFKLRSR
jgi:hypothetical protein